MSIILAYRDREGNHVVGGDEGLVSGGFPLNDIKYRYWCSKNNEIRLVICGGSLDLWVEDVDSGIFPESNTGYVLGLRDIESMDEFMRTRYGVAEENGYIITDNNKVIMTVASFGESERLFDGPLTFGKAPIVEGSGYAHFFQLFEQNNKFLKDDIPHEKIIECTLAGTCAACPSVYGKYFIKGC